MQLENGLKIQTVVSMLKYYESILPRVKEYWLPEINNKINVRVYFWDTSKNEITFKEKDYYKREIEKEIRKKIISKRNKHN